MNGLNRYDTEKLLDDIKLISKTVKLIKVEDNLETRKYVGGLIEDLLNRLYRDIREMRGNDYQNGQTFGCPKCKIEDMPLHCPTCSSKGVCKYYLGGK